MKKESAKLSFLFLVSILVVVLLAGFVFAEEGDMDTSVDQTGTDFEDNTEDYFDTGSDASNEDDFYDDYDDEDMAEEDSVIDLEEVEAEIEEEYGDDLGDVGTSAPGYIEWLLKNFRDELENKERKIGDIKKHIQNGDFEKARIALEEYRYYAEMLEEEINPDKRDEARKSAVRIRKALREIEDEIPEEEREDFYDEIIETETGILTAAEIASKISELCNQLAQLDPFEYSRICKIDDDAPDWQKKKHKEWTEEQRKEAEEFGSIMKDCFRTSGRECRCSEITFYDFSVACEKASSLAVECDEGDEDSCRALDEVEMPELPEHLQDVFDEVEAKEAQFENHMPYECVSAGATTGKECSKIMIEVGAPPECKQALLDSGCESERECSKICDEIMMPEECKNQGLDSRECGINMFREEAPQECIEAGITGESRDDPRKCKELMEGKMKRGDFGPGFGPDCMSIKDDMERLACFDGKLTESGDHYGPRDGEGEITWQCKEHRIHWGPDCEEFMKNELPKILEMEKGDRNERFEDIKKRERDCAETCERDGKAWDFRGGNCKCFGGDDQGGGDQRGNGALCDDCQSQCPDKPGQRLKGTGCGSNGCECYYESDDSDNNQGGDQGGDNQNGDTGGGDTDTNGGGDTGGDTGGGTDDGGDTGGDTGGGDTGEGDTGEGDTGEGDTGDDTGGEDPGITGNVFLEYYYD